MSAGRPVGVVWPRNREIMVGGRSIFDASSPMWDKYRDSNGALPPSFPPDGTVTVEHDPTWCWESIGRYEQHDKPGPKPKPPEAEFCVVRTALPPFAIDDVTGKRFGRFVDVPADKPRLSAHNDEMLDRWSGFFEPNDADAEAEAEQRMREKWAREFERDRSRARRDVREVMSEGQLDRLFDKEESDHEHDGNMQQRAARDL
jgi:hypothetical protein